MKATTGRGAPGLAMFGGKKPEKVGLLVNAMMAGLTNVHGSLLLGGKLGRFMIAGSNYKGKQ